MDEVALQAKLLELEAEIKKRDEIIRQEQEEKIKYAEILKEQEKKISKTEDTDVKKVTEEYSKKLTDMEMKMKLKEIESAFKSAKIKDVKFLPMLSVNPDEYYTDGELDEERLKAKIIETKATHGYLYDTADEQEVRTVKKDTQIIDAKDAFKKYIDRLLN